jgi:m7GpppX diphosphatase
MSLSKAEAESLIPAFKLERILNQGMSFSSLRHPPSPTSSPKSPNNNPLPTDQAGRRTIAYGHIQSPIPGPAILILERAPFSASASYIAKIPASLQSISNLGANDVYFWYLASSGVPHEQLSVESANEFADLKINLIYPCTETHLKKYSKQGVRMVVETPQIYKEKIRPFMLKKREGTRLSWVWNIIEGKTEVEDVIYRTPFGEDVDEGYILIPDLNWDRKTLESLHLLCLVERRDIWSLRDLKKGHLKWLRHMREKLIESTVKMYGDKGLEADQLKLYVHYQPTYYHLHIHIVHVALEAGATQATGKAIGLESIIEQIQAMEGDAGMEGVELHYTVGEASELWTDIFEPIKNGIASQNNN